MHGVYTIVMEKDEDGWFVGHAPALPGCHTQAGSIDELMERMTEAITLWIESVAGGEHLKSPRPVLGA